MKSCFSPRVSVMWQQNGNDRIKTLTEFVLDSMSSSVPGLKSLRFLNFSKKHALFSKSVLSAKLEFCNCFKVREFQTYKAQNGRFFERTNDQKDQRPKNQTINYRYFIPVDSIFSGLYKDFPWKFLMRKIGRSTFDYFQHQNLIVEGCTLQIPQKSGNLTCRFFLSPKEIRLCNYMVHITKFWKSKSLISFLFSR